MKNGCICVSEGANIPTVPEGVGAFVGKKICFGPCKAANAGGVAASGLEMVQNAAHMTWTREEVDGRLKLIMKCIYETCVWHGQEDDSVDYVKGADIGGFVKVADAMLDQGVVQHAVAEEVLRGTPHGRAPWRYGVWLGDRSRSVILRRASPPPLGPRPSCIEFR